MTKQLYIGDLHAGVRDGSQLMIDFQLKFLDEVIQYCVDNNIDTIVQFGDTFDVRKHTQTNVLKQWKERFFDKLVEKGIRFITLCGNHDTVYKNTLFPNALDTNLSSYSNVEIITKPTELTLGGIPTLIVPWICRDNEEECMKAIETSDAKNCIGHFEVKGAMMESSVCTEGLPISTFRNFDLCMSGHFHIAGQYDNVKYLGTPYEMSWADFGVPKGFWVMHTELNKLEFVKNPHTLYHKITYNEDNSMDEFLEESEVNGKYVKVVIEKRENFAKYEAWLMKLEVMGMVDLKVIEPMMGRDSDEVEVDVERLETASTTDLIKDYVGELYPEKSEKLATMMVSLHNEAQRTFG